MGGIHKECASDRPSSGTNSSFFKPSELLAAQDGAETVVTSFSLLGFSAESDIWDVEEDEHKEDGKTPLGKVFHIVLRKIMDSLYTVPESFMMDRLIRK